MSNVTYDNVTDIEVKGKSFVLIGFDGYRSTVEEKAITYTIEKLGGEIKGNAGVKTSYCILSEAAYPTGLTKVEKLKEAGHPIKIITPMTFLHAFYKTDFIVDEDDKRLMFYIGNKKDIVIPDGIMYISDHAFCGCNIESVTIPESVVEIREYAFYNCEELKSVKLPGSLTRIAMNAFGFCESIKSMVIPENVKVIEAGTFWGCTSLENVKLPEKLERIGNSAFERCTNLREINVSDNVNHIGAKAFAECNALADKSGFFILNETLYNFSGSDKIVKIPDGIVKIDTGAFKSNGRITKVILPESVRKIGSEAFWYCQNLEEIIGAANLKKIDKYAFAHCKKLRSISGISADTTLGESVFRECVCFSGTSDLWSNMSKDDILSLYNSYSKNIPYWLVLSGAISDTHEAWVDFAEEAKKHKKEIIENIMSTNDGTGMAIFLSLYKNIKLSVIDGYIEQSTQNNCTDVTAVLLEYKSRHYTFDAIEKNEEEKINKELGINDDAEKLAKDPFSASVLKKTWSYDVMEDGTLMITSYKGSECEVTVPKQIGKKPVSKIGDFAFSPFRSDGSSKPFARTKVLNAIETVHIPDSVTEICDDAFNSCEMLSGINLPEKLKRIGERAFMKCRNLANVIIPESVQEIGEEAFFGCKNLADKQGFIIFRGVLHNYVGRNKDVSIPDGVTAIGRYAFFFRYSITGITIPDSVTKIGEGAFKACAALTAIKLPAGITEIGNNVFKKCESLANIEIPEGVTKIGVEAFLGCNDLASITIPDTVTEIGYQAFKGCKNILFRVKPKSFAEKYAKKRKFPIITE